MDIVRRRSRRSDVRQKSMVSKQRWVEDGCQELGNDQRTSPTWWGPVSCPCRLVAERKEGRMP